MLLYLIGLFILAVLVTSLTKYKSKPTLYIPVGISGSGKSTYINSWRFLFTKIVSPDLLRKAYTGNINDQTKNQQIFSDINTLIVCYLNSGNSVITDSTNCNLTFLKKLLTYLKESVTVKFNIKFLIFESNPEISEARINKDIKKGKVRSNTPKQVLINQYKGYIEVVDYIKSNGFDYKIVK